MARRRLRIGILTSCLFLALVLWGFVTLTRTYEDDVLVPLTVIAPPNQALLSTVPSEISVHVRASGLQILSLKYVNRNALCVIDLSKLNPSSQGVFTVDREHFVRGISTSEPVSIQSVFPASVTMATGDLFVKTVPVQLRTNIASRDGFEVIGKPLTDPPHVEIRGTKSVIESITTWPTKRISLADLREPLSTVVDMSDSLTTLLNVVPPRVRVNVNVQQIANVCVRDVPVTLASDQRTRVFPRYISVTVRGGIEELASLTANNVAVTVTPDVYGYVKPTVTVPPSVEVVATDPSWLRIINMASP